MEPYLSPRPGTYFEYSRMKHSLTSTYVRLGRYTLTHRLVTHAYFSVPNGVQLEAETPRARVIVMGQ